MDISQYWRIETSNLIIYIIGLILLIIWKVTFETQTIGGVSSSGYKQNTPLFGESVGSGSVDFQLMKKVVTTVGTFGDYIDEIWQSYELGFTPYRLHTNSYGTFVTPIRVYDGRVYVSDDETTMQVSNRKIATDKISSKLIYVYCRGR